MIRIKALRFNMSFVQRSPPYGTASNKTTLSLDHSSSAPDLKEALSNSNQDFVNLTNRYKRPRMDETESQLGEFKDEIKDLLSSWKADHSVLSKLVSDQMALIARLVTDMAELKVQNSKIEKSNSEIEKSIMFVTEQYEDIKCQNKTLQEDLKRNRAYTETLERKIQDIQHKSRSSSIELRNVPKGEKETTPDLINLITSVGNVVNFTISSSDIRDVYRRSGKPGTIGPIIAEFSTVQRKMGLLSSVRTFNSKQQKDYKLNTDLIGIPGKKQPIYVDEHLPGTVRTLFYQARIFAKQNGYNFCWTSNSNIFIRKHPGDKQILVTSETTLRDLQEKQ